MLTTSDRTVIRLRMFAVDILAAIPEVGATFYRDERIILLSAHASSVLLALHLARVLAKVPGH
jgi:hypothetical protein